MELSHNLIDFLITKKVRFIAIDALGIRNGKDQCCTVELLLKYKNSID